MLQMIQFISHPSCLLVRLWLYWNSLFDLFCSEFRLVQVPCPNPVILRTKVFPKSSNFRRSRRSSFARPSGMLAIWKSTLGGCRPSDKGAVCGGGGLTGFATGVSYYFWRSLVVLAQCWDLWSLLFTIQLYISSPQPFPWNWVFSYFIRRILKRKPTTTPGENSIKQLFSPIQLTRLKPVLHEASFHLCSWKGTGTELGLDQHIY